MRLQSITASLAIGLAAVVHAAAPDQITIDPTLLTTLASDLRGTEGPSALADGSVALVEPMSGKVLRVNTDGTREVLTTTGMGVAGTAVGRNNALYVAKINLAGLLSRPPPGVVAPGAGGNPPMTASPAAILRIDLKTGEVRNLYTAYQGTLLEEPNDLVVDEWGDLWFTDAANGSVYWARADGSDIQRPIADAQGVNGIALSPDRRTVYIIGNGKLLGFTITARGKLKQASGRAVAREVATIDPKLGRPDGMKTEANGDILLACGEDGILRYSPAGKLLSQTRFPGVAIVNLAFGGKDGRTLYLADRTVNDNAGRLQSMRWPRAGAIFP